ncbi:MAG: AAA family ATPase [Caldilineaceae bacterium]
MFRPLPVTTQTFRKIIEGGLLYVDKTQYLYELLRNPTGAYFLARPRRFGKSLLISTLEEAFQGNRELFQGLWLYQSDYHWKTYPVIRLDFSLNTVKTAAALEQVIDYYLERIAQQHGITVQGFDYQSRFQDLIQQLAQGGQKVVILIDEYDKPLIDNLDHIEEAKQIRDTLKAFYTVIKAMDAYVRFVFITGISKSSRVGVFSAMNNLSDLTMHPRFATALGLTEDEIKHNFQAYIAAFSAKESITLDEFLAKMRYWYNGFCFAAGCESVYNPFSTLNLFDQQRFYNFWFESGTPTFVLTLIKERGYDVTQLQNLQLRELAFSTYELETLSIVPLLFQTGYLTIKGYEPEIRRYTLGHPNYEVEDAFSFYLLSAFSALEPAFSEDYLWQLIDALSTQDFVHVFTVLDAFFANIDYDLHIKQEKYYQTIFYLIFLLLGLRIRAEVKTNQGRIDAVVELDEHILLFEFKLDDSAATALQQIKDTAYYQKYQGKGKKIIGVGVNFDSTQRKISEWKREELP